LVIDDRALAIVDLGEIWPLTPPGIEQLNGWTITSQYTEDLAEEWKQGEQIFPKV